MPLAVTAHAAGRTGTDPISPLKEAARDRKPASPLSQDDQTRLNEMQSRDREVRAHEKGHKAAGGRHAGAISLDYQKGPDGKRHVVAGELPIEASPVPGDPEETVAKMEYIKSAALAPAHPSAQDKAVAQAAQSQILEAEAKIRKHDQERLESDRADKAAHADDAEHQLIDDKRLTENSENQHLERTRSAEHVRTQAAEAEQTDGEARANEVLKSEMFDEARSAQETSNRSDPQAAQGQSVEARIRQQDQERLKSDHADEVARAEDNDRQRISDDVRAENSENQRLERTRSTELVRSQSADVERAEHAARNDAVLKAELLDDAHAAQENSKRIFLQPASRNQPDPAFVRDHAAQAYTELSDFIAKEADTGDVAQP